MRFDLGLDQDALELVPIERERDRGNRGCDAVGKVTGLDERRLRARHLHVDSFRASARSGARFFRTEEKVVAPPPSRYNGESDRTTQPLRGAVIEEVLQEDPARWRGNTAACYSLRES